ncbi:thiamine pyrophosphate-dependent enzyme, partial [Chloroflexota bacterium]
NFEFNRITWGDKKLGVITTGVAYQYAREVFLEASFLKIGMPFPLPEKLVREFAAGVSRVIVIEELEPFIEEQIRLMGIAVEGKSFISNTGELSTKIVVDGAVKAGLLSANDVATTPAAANLTRRPPLLCSGCSHSGFYHVLSGLGGRAKLPGTEGKADRKPRLVITGDIGCYTLGAYPPLSALDTTTCMGASIGEAVGMQKAGLAEKVVAVIGDSTFMHSGITGLVNAVYNQSPITVAILDNGTTAMTGHQEHPGTGVSASGQPAAKVEMEELVRGIGVREVSVVDAFDIKLLRQQLRAAIASPELSVLIVRGECAVRAPKGIRASFVDTAKCDDCGVCLLIGCSAIQKKDRQVFIDANLCVGDACTICCQVCPHQAIAARP